MACELWGGLKSEEMIKRINELKAHDIKFEDVWIDAGWYPCDYVWQKTGTWRHNEENFPRGLKPIGDRCKEIGMEFLLWFEPERIQVGTEFAEAHPQWCLKSTIGEADNPYLLVNLGDAACCEFVTDMLDGFIARHFNQITECGKLLDPISDKLTQVAVLIALATRYRELLPLVILCVIKETCQAIGGVIMIKRRNTVQGSLWFGKLSTVVFYVCMLVLVVSTLFDVTLSPNMCWLVSALAGACMLVAFVGYLRVFILASRKGKPVSDETEKG